VAYTSDDLLTEVRRAASLPAATSGVTPSDVDLLAHGDSEIRDTLVPALIQVREEFYQRIFDITVTAGTAGYRINKRASLSRLNTVQWVGGDGAVVNLDRLEPKRVVELTPIAASGQPWAYYLEGSRVVLYPTPSAAGTLRLRAMVRPSQLCLSADVAGTNLVISDVSTSAPDYFITTTTAHGITTTAVRDIVAGTPSFEHLALDVTVTKSGAGTFLVSTPTANFTTAPAIGDYVTASDKTPMIQLPVEMHPALVELVAARALRSLGKLTEAASHEEKAQELVRLAITALAPRVDSAEMKIVGGPMWRRRNFAGAWYR